VKLPAPEEFRMQNSSHRELNFILGLMPLRNPQDLPLSLSFGGYQKALWHLQFLRRRSQSPASYCKQAIVSLFTLCRASKQIEEKNIYVFSASLAALPPRAAGEGNKKRFCKKVS